MAESLLQQAFTHFKQGELEQAQNLCEQLLDTEPENITALEFSAIVCANRNQLHQAETYCLQAIHLNPEQVSLHNNLGNIVLKQHRPKDSIKHFKQALKLDPKSINAHNNLGNAYFQQQLYDKSKHHYQQALQLDPNNVDALFNYSVIQCLTGQHSLAQKNLLKVITIDPEFTPAHGQLAELYLQDKQFEQASEHFMQRLELEPEHSESWHSLGQAQLQLHNLEEAIISFKQCLAHKHKHPQANQDLANALVKKGDLPTALSFYMRQIEVNPLPESYFNVGVLLMYQERNKDAIDYFEQTLLLDADYLGAHMNLASMYLKKNKPTQAKKHYEAILKQHPDDKEIQYILAAINQEKPPESAPKEYLQNLFNQYAAYYDKHLAEHLHYKVPAALKKALTAYIHTTDACLKILDLGCGSGLCGAEFKPWAETLIGIDIAENMLAIAKEKALYDQLICDDIMQSLPHYKDFDLILAADVFTYKGDIAQCLILCAQALKPGGLIGFSVEKTEQQNFVLQSNCRYAHNQDYLKHTLQAAGFEILSLEPTELRQQQRQPVLGYCVVARLKQLAL